MRRYRHPSGAVLMVGPGRECRAIPAWCAFIDAPISRRAAAVMLREIRADKRRA